MNDILYDRNFCFPQINEPKIRPKDPYREPLDVSVKNFEPESYVSAETNETKQKRFGSDKTSVETCFGRTLEWDW